MEITLYAFQFSPNAGETMFFSQTLERCRAEAMEERTGLKNHPDYGDLSPFPLYECVMRMDIATYIAVLNDPSEAVERALVSKKLIGLVME